MPTQTDTREGLVTAVDSFTKLTGDGAGGTLQDITVPVWANSIKHIAACVGVDGAAGAGVVHVKLSGATKYGDQIVALVGHTNAGTTVGIAGADVEDDYDIPVNPGKALEIYGAFAGADTGSPELGITVTFSEKPGNHAYVTRNALLTTVDTWQTLNTENGTTAVNDHITQGRKIDQIRIVAAFGATAAEPQALYAKIQGVGGCIAGNEHVFSGPSLATSDGTLADTAFFKAMIYDVDIACSPGTVRLQGVNSAAAATIDPECSMTVVYQV